MPAGLGFIVMMFVQCTPVLLNVIVLNIEYTLDN